MRRFFKLAGGLALILVVGTGVASAQTLSEILTGNVDSDDGSSGTPFTCSDGTECLIFQRVYGDLDPTLINQSTTEDGYPSFRGKQGRWAGDGFSTANYPGINSAVAQTCEAWNGVWTAAVNPAGADYQTFYAAQATIVNNGEVGATGQPDCVVASLPQGACMGEIQAGANNNTGGAAYPNAPFGPVDIFANGLEPVPVPELAIGADSSVLTVSWQPAAMVNLTNIASSTDAPCAPGATFNDLLGAAELPDNPVWGVRLFAYLTNPATPAQPGDFRSLLDLEGASATAAGGIDVLSNAGNGGLACAGTGADPNCPGVFQIPCNATDGACTPDGMDFAPDAQSFSLTQGAVDAAVGGLASGQGFVLLTKVVFRGAVAGSTSSGAPNVNPSLVSLFSANSTVGSFSGLISSVALEARAGRGPFVELTATTTGEVLSMSLSRAEDGVNFEPIGTIEVVPGQNEYTFNDRIRGRGSASLTYKLQYSTPSGTAQTFATYTGKGANRGR